MSKQLLQCRNNYSYLVSIDILSIHLKGTNNTKYHALRPIHPFGYDLIMLLHSQAAGSHRQDTDGHPHQDGSWG
jgi:hypothetical protein